MAMIKLVKLQIKQQERQQRTEKLHEKWEEKQELQLNRQQRVGELQFEHQKQLSERLQHTKELLAQILKNNAHTDNDTAFSQDSIWNAIDNFHCEREEDKSFTAYYRRYEDVFSIDCKNWSDQK